MVLSIRIQEADCYHEAGHAAMFVYYDIPLEYVRIRPDLAAGYGGSVKTAVAPPTMGIDELQNWMRASAAGEVAVNWRVGRKELTTGQLIAKFSQALQSIAEHPDFAVHDDMRNFAYLGIYRDGLTAPEKARPEEWIPVWRETEQLISSTLRPAVQEVAIKLWAMVDANAGSEISTLPDLSGAEAASIVLTALGRA
jgi:hypothetical protein